MVMQNGIGRDKEEKDAMEEVTARLIYIKAVGNDRITTEVPKNGGEVVVDWMLPIILWTTMEDKWRSRGNSYYIFI